MYYRRKIILALIERFGGELKPTHFQKLLLVFTRRQRKPAYEFVPYKYGAFSFQVNVDFIVTRASLTNVVQLWQESEKHGCSARLPMNSAA